VIPIQGMNSFTGIVNIFILVVLNQVSSNIITKEDPFDNSFLLSTMIFIITIQRFFFSLSMLYKFKANTVLNEAGVEVIPEPIKIYGDFAITRYVVMAMEFIFILVPLRHNF
jgi:hypothetical protein